MIKFLNISVWLLLSLFVFQLGLVYAQTSQIKVIFKVDEKEIEVCNYQVFISDPKNKIEPIYLQTNKDIILVPSNIKEYSGVNVRIIFGEYDLKFYNIDPTLFNREWVVGVKKPPFEEDEEIPEEISNKKLKMIYYINFHPQDSEGRVQKTYVTQ